MRLRELSFTVGVATLQHGQRLNNVVDMLESSASELTDWQSRRLIRTVATDMIERALTEHRVPEPPQFDC